jgi:hypothetical protein
MNSRWSGLSGVMSRAFKKPPPWYILVRRQLVLALLLLTLFIPGCMLVTYGCSIVYPRSVIGRNPVLTKETIAEESQPNRTR